MFESRRSSRVAVAGGAFLLALGGHVSALAQAPCDGALRVEGRVVVRYVAAHEGCWHVEDAAGHVYEVIDGPLVLYCDGAEGDLVGCRRPDLTPGCKADAVVEVIEFAPETFTVHGAVRFIGVEGGCWQFLADDGTPYEPVNGPAEMFEDGVTGRLTAAEICLLGSTCQVGRIVQVVEFIADATCPADLDGDGAVSFRDVLMLLFAWGTDDADLDGDGATDFRDLLALLSSWGPC